MSRKITQEAINAFLFSEFRHFDKSNTSVIQYVGEDLKPVTRCLRLHGNDIAYKDEITGEIKISNAGWFSNTTKERLNGIPGVRISQKKGEWYLNGVKWDGEWISLDNLIF